jgi:hypothetical protein
MFDAISLTINIGMLGYFMFSLFTGGLESFANNYVFIGYLIFTTLTLPNFLARVIFKSRIFGFVSALSFLYFPIQFLLQLLVANLTGLSLSEILPFGVIFNLILWNVLFLLFVIGDNKSGNESEFTLGEILSGMLPAIIYVIFTFVLIRQRDSVVALDYLQHLTVPNKMFNDGILCILPGQCSNLFLQHGYTTFYHLVFGNLSTFIGTNSIKTFYMLDIVFPLVVSIPIYLKLKEITKSTPWSQLGVLLALLTFVMGGYDFVFFIPQTFALYLLILALREKELKLPQLFFISILLVSTHFIIGTVFAGYLWFRFLIIRNLKTRKEKTVFLLLLLLSVIFFCLANIAGFSTEKLLQEEAVKVIGSLTNAYYPSNLTVYIQNLGAGWLLVIVAYFSVLINRKRDVEDLSLLSFITFGISFYFLAPTYANKFAIGLGFFVTILIIKYLWKLGFKPAMKIVLFMLLIPIWGLNYFVQYSRYLTFYTQEDGTASAIVKEDEAIIEYLTENNLTDRFIVSDPYTQIIIASLGNIDTVNAQYMPLETRENLLRYLENPSAQTYEQLLTSPGIPAREDITILYTSRLHRSIELNDQAWLYNVYSLPTNNSYSINEVGKYLIEDQERLNNDLIYISDNFVLLK